MFTSRRQQRSGKPNEATRAYWKVLAGLIAPYGRVSTRQMFYISVKENLIEKTQPAYEALSQTLTRMREQGALGWDAIVDYSREVYSDGSTWPNAGAALPDLAGYFRLDWWKGTKRRPALWAEKQSLLGTVEPIARRWRVPLFIGKGQSSASYLHEAAGRCQARGITDMLVLSDADLHGERIVDSMREGLAFHGVRLDYDLLALTPKQAQKLRLPSRPANRQSRDLAWGHEAWDLEAMPIETLQALIADALDEFMPARKRTALAKAENGERRRIAEATL